MVEVEQKHVGQHGMHACDTTASCLLQIIADKTEILLWLHMRLIWAAAHAAAH